VYSPRRPCHRSPKSLFVYSITSECSARVRRIEVFCRTLHRGTEIRAQQTCIDHLVSPKTEGLVLCFLENNTSSDFDSDIDSLMSLKNSLRQVRASRLHRSLDIFHVNVRRVNRQVISILRHQTTNRQNSICLRSIEAIRKWTESRWLIFIINHLPWPTKDYEMNRFCAWE
jgi:hypothetical protein